MTPDLKQTDKYSNSELALLKKLFGGESRILYALRNLLWQFPLTKEERKDLDLSPDEYQVIKKALLPENSPDIPIGWILNNYQSLVKIRDFAPQGALIHIKANDVKVEYFRQQFNYLVSGEENRKIVLEELPKEHGSLDEEERFVNMLAYHEICTSIEGRIQELKAKANPPKEKTAEELKAQAEKDSTQ